ncbi:glyoxylase-like metal-dependent hydrolase (beta-lactamase superfamily II) [Deinococcus metalli]|uniref:Glyoxylase-like metal-dependent hydrolase (Beta-lactamase superfamily II) n=1 Tax=Deinococcus metalli TaxID=1141878 RepID=A0A7W8NN66_9DEIO|nr:MBL fold metallo-hydrolase [Deinococcus metalli]MBB5376564.1 glyoxylase-like metal-dependent hydrolase (beta-lactamase superfamily II) [Deinococcus metalli]GHF43104.1 hypothetical protein GCM10017781_19380 [Deinococcus metalli]
MTVPHALAVPTGRFHFLRSDVVRLRLPLANVYFLGRPGDSWVLVDAGVPGTARTIRNAATQVHGDRPPEAIVLTHGHLDHIGALHALLERWPVPVYAHPLERPCLTGRVPYPFPDPSVGGSMSVLSPALSPGPFSFQPAVQDLPEDGTVPGLPGWEWRHTPGHANGHVSLWRGSDRTLIAGDAVVTTRQESLLSALTLRPAVVHGPPAYYTPNWDAARDSVRRLAHLQPDLLAPGHGHPLRGEGVATDLHRLARNFDEAARPNQGWYRRHPVPVTLPQPGRRDPVRWAVLGALALLGSAWLLQP